MGLEKSSEQRIGPGSASMFEEEFLEIEVTVWGAGGVLGPFVANLRTRTGSARLGVRSPPFSPPPLPPPPAPSLLLARRLR